MEISDLVKDTGISPFQQEGEFNFEIKTPSGEEYGLTYTLRNSKNKYDPSKYILTHAIKWKDPQNPKTEEEGIPVSGTHVDVAIKETELTINHIFKYLISKEKDKAA